MRIAEVLQEELRIYRQQTQETPSQQNLDHIRVLELLGRMAKEVDHLNEVFPLLLEKLSEIQQREEK